MQKGFKRRIFTPRILASDIWFLLKNIRKFAVYRRNPTLDRAFLEKIMSVVTAVNGCVYCSWFHAREASAAGLDQAEIDDLFQLQFDTKADEFELPALIYAQHFAETGRKPNPEETAAFKGYYGAKTAGEIMLFIRMILFGNLLGNTYDAFLSRLKGVPAFGSNVIFEFFFFLFSFPVMFPASIVMKKDNRNKAKAG
ncbi:MAG: carboxymuconolactone decarboxylase family protein [Candidatus Cloacimonadaceae bacterium]|nr:carboxymuconolactone decarboxylase family protein [Candidatus Cloacimonadota bacterium]MDY0126526.1 carboxymuconolactone decarboxylase family protein [Candidatus Cloacimonadaceae bacterium]MCB5255391.1 carboxymuconolactone decarboxylase family protein [Candidatus Cloacimonadota bacterium]MCK9177540.1 carboxymuconolactone decarboxylase family protein [Candidatus Cloacimonadota bacterium]MCK9243291.1 carboxymuconolactone decarboxylase family protein [Candidatus Cloacimonadota bacterium]